MEARDQGRAGPPPGEGGARGGGGAARLAVAWGVLAVFWVALAGIPHGPAESAFALAGVTLVSLWTYRFFPTAGPLGKGALALLRLVLYLPWLLWEIWLAALDVFGRVLGLKPVDPRVVSFRPDLESDFARVALANSITLTPGTVTIEVADDTFIVHAIAPESAGLLRSGRLERRLRRVEGRRS